jgi:PAT family beta-lactamase induction signal transducer AmpG
MPSTTLRSMFSRRMLVALLTGFSSGLPLLLTGGTLQAWLVDEKVDIKSIGLFAAAGLPYTLKFLWSPIFDRYGLPFLGRRRGWMLVIQLCLAAALALLGQTNPAFSLWSVAVAALIVAFISASQDIVLDAYRRESLAERELGFGSGLFINGYRLAILVSGALALFLADHIPWRAVYLVMAGALTVGVVATFIAVEPPIEAPPPRTLREAVVDPFVDFFRRRGAVLILVFILLYKIGDQMASSMTTPFILALGFSKSELAAIVKIFGMASTMLGALVGGALMLRMRIGRALLIFGVLQAAAILAYVALAQVGKVHAVLATAISLEMFTAGMGTSAYAAYMASLTNKKFTATQYALFSSLMGVPRVFFGMLTGFVAAQLGWAGYFIFCTLAAVPGLVLLRWIAEPTAQDDVPQKKS